MMKSLYNPERIVIMISKLKDSITSIYKDTYAQVLVGIFALAFGMIKSLSEYIYNENMIGVDIQLGGDML